MANETLDAGAKDSQERAAEALKYVTGAREAIHESLGTLGTIQERLERNNAIGQNLMREEIGVYGPYSGTHYDLDDATRDILLAHGRQDAAHAVINSIDLLRRLDRLERSQRRLIWMIPLVTVIMAAIGICGMIALR